MTTILILSFLFVTTIVWSLISFTSAALNQYSNRFAAGTEAKMRQLFLFTDTRKLTLGYLVTLIALPLIIFLSGLGILLSVAALFIVLMAPRVLLGKLALRRSRLINESLPDALAQLSGAMMAGSTFVMAMQSYVDEQSGPLSQEFSLVLREQRVGARLDGALDNLAERVQSEEMDLVVSASLIASDVGGNLAEILQNLAENIRRKLEMEGKVSALTAQGRLQGLVVSSLPFGILLPLSFFEPDATLPIFHSLLGWIFLAVIVVMVTIGGLFIRKIVNVDI